MELDLQDILDSMQRQIGEYAKQVAMLEATIAQLQRADETSNPSVEDSP